MRANARERIDANLRGLQEEFKTLLLAALQRCAAGTWGLFGQNDHVAAANPNLRGICTSADAEALREVASEIRRLRDRLGFSEPYILCERFEYYRAIRGANAPGEPKLAKQFLSELAGE